MKKMIFFTAFLVLILAQVFGSGGLQREPVNVQEIELDQIETIEIRYRSDRITLYTHNSNKLIIKEYMSENNSSYYARINHSGNRLTVEAGRRPIRPIFGYFSSHIEIFIPVSNKNFSIRTSSGRIDAPGEYTASSLDIQSFSGRISVNSVTADRINIRTTSGSITGQNATGNTAINTTGGSIDFSVINGDVTAESSSGRIEISRVSGSLIAKSFSGRIQSEEIVGDADVRAKSGNIKIGNSGGNVLVETTSGRVTLGLPRNSAYNFSSRTSSGSLNTPFQERLSIPLSDRRSVHGVIYGDNIFENQIYRNINIRTGSGSIRVNWVN